MRTMARKLGPFTLVSVMGLGVDMLLAKGLQVAGLAWWAAVPLAFAAAAVVNYVVLAKWVYFTVASIAGYGRMLAVNGGALAARMLVLGGLVMLGWDSAAWGSLVVAVGVSFTLNFVATHVWVMGGGKERA